jgi:hypothetical protein
MASAFEPTNIAESFGVLDPVNITAPAAELVASAPLSFLNPFDPGDSPPIIKNLPSAIAQFRRKYESIPEALRRDPTVQAMIQMDAGRVQQGQSPLGMEQTINAIVAAKQKSPVTEAPRANPFNPRNWLGNAARDVGNIAMGIPRLPAALVREAVAVRARIEGAKPGDDYYFGGLKYEVPDAADPGNPISRFLDTPGVRILPLANTVSRTAEGDFASLAQNPVSTVLDVLPVVAKAASLTPAARAAAEAGKAAELARAARVADGGIQYTTSAERAAIRLAKRPITATAKDIAGRVTPEPVADLIGRIRGNSVVADVAGTNGVFGQTSRDLSRVVDEAQTYAKGLVDDEYPLPDGFDNLPEAEQQTIRANREATRLGREFADLDADARGRVQTALELDDIGSLSDRELEFAAAARESRALLDDAKINAGDLVRDAASGELYLPEQARRLAAADHLSRTARTLADLRDRILTPQRAADAALADAYTLTNAPELRGLGRDAANGADALTRPAGALTPKRKIAQLDGLLHEAEAAGANVDDLRVLVKEARKVMRDPAKFRAALDTFAERAAARADEVVAGLNGASEADNIIAATRTNIASSIDAATSLHGQRLQALEALEARAQVAHDAAKYRAQTGVKGASAEVYSTGLKLDEAREAVARGRERAAAELESTRGELLRQLDEAEAQYAASRSTVLRRSMTPDEMRAALQPHLADPLVRSMYDDLGRGNLRAARDTAVKIEARKNFRVPGMGDMLDNIRRAVERENFINAKEGLGGMNDKRAAAIAKRAAKLRTKTVPTRFRDVMATDVDALPASARSRIEDAALEDAYNQVAPGAITPAARADLIDAVLTRNYAAYPELAAAIPEHMAAIQANWERLAAIGLDPTYMSHVSLTRAKSAMSLKVTDFPKSAASLKERAADLSPYIKDPIVSLQTEAWELQRRYVAEDLADAVGHMVGTPAADLKATYLARAEELVASGRMDPRIPLDDIADELVRRDYQPYSPTGLGYNWGGKRLAAIEDAQLMIPKQAAKQLERMFAAPTVNSYTKVVNPVLGAFRTSVLALSPRFLFNNVFGGAVTSTMQSGIGVWRALPEAIRLAQGGPAEISELLRGTLGGAARDIDEFGLAYLQGRTLGRMHKAAEDARLAGIAESVKRPLDWAKGKSYDINGWFDNTYRLMNYIYGKRKGLTEPAAVELARGVLQNMSDMTPFERNVLRNIAPFYSFTQHMIRFAFRYPFDHPVRASILASVARIELEDQGSGMPNNMLNFLFVGKGDAQGNRLSINVGSLNPFRDLHTFGTLTGFMSQVNPVIATAAEQIGVKNGQAELYPNLVFDPTTGRFRASQPNAVSSLIGNTIPQTRLLAALFVSRNQFAEQFQRNPRAALQSVSSGLGIPSIIRTQNEDTIRFKQELALEKAQDEAFAEALRTGDYSYASRFPGLAKQIAAARLLQVDPAGAPYRP